MSAISAPQYTIYISILEFAVLLLIYNFCILCKDKMIKVVNFYIKT